MFNLPKNPSIVYRKTLEKPFNHLAPHADCPANAMHQIEIDAMIALALHSLVADWDTSYPLQTVGRCKLCFKRRCTIVEHINNNPNDFDYENLIGVCASCAGRKGITG
jgi:hypothetical protein